MVAGRQLVADVEVGRALEIVDDDRRVIWQLVHVELVGDLFDVWLSRRPVLLLRHEQLLDLHRIQVLQALVNLVDRLLEGVVVVGGEAERLVLQFVELALAASVDVGFALLHFDLVLRLR